MRVVSAASAVAPSNIIALDASIVTVSTVFVVPDTTKSPDTVKLCEIVTLPDELIATASVSLVCPILSPLIMILSTVRVVRVPSEVIAA